MHYTNTAHCKTKPLIDFYIGQDTENYIVFKKETASDEMKKIRK